MDLHQILQYQKQENVKQLITLEQEALGIIQQIN